MARPRKPTKILELSGAFKHDPQRARPNEPRESRPLGEPPGRLPADVIPYWLELADMVTGGILTYRDRWAVELCARLMEKAVREKSAAVILELAREAEMGVDEIKALAKSETISSSELATLRSLLASLGMTPADRSKLSVPQEKPSNRFATLAQEAKNLAGRPN